MLIKKVEKKAFIIYEKYYDFINKRVLSGGVQSYISNLVPILCEVGYKCIVYQFEQENKSDEIFLEKCVVKSVPKSLVAGRYNTNIILKYIRDKFDKDNDLLIFADHILTVKNNAKHSLSIQHGIHWDIPEDASRRPLKMFLSKAKFAYEMHKQMGLINHVICVDYNFLNWYRTQVDIPNSNFTVVPNFTKISGKNKKSDDKIKIIFARRFVKHRGTRVFAEAIDRILMEYENVEVTVAGRGPDEEYLHNKLDKYGQKVIFIHYTSEESLKIHSDKHIALIPTVGSEGTSLSILEAMSAQCATICTDVGGLTNIILNHYNGLMVSAGDINELYSAVKFLINNPEKRKEIAKNGYETVKLAFSYERWAEQWKKLLLKIDLE